MKLKLNALKVSSLLSRDQMKTVMAGYGDGYSNECGTCKNSLVACSGSGGNCSCYQGSSCEFRG